MSVIQAYLGGIHSFFSIWIFCLLQVIPFFFAFVIGIGVKEKEGGPFPELVKRILTVGIVPFIGFIIFFVLMGMRTTSLNKTIFEYLNLSNQLGSVVIGLISFYFIGWLTFKEKPETLFAAIKLIFGFLFGAGLAFAYKPCVTPTLSKIYMISSSVETAGMGGILLISYALGVSTVIFGFAFALALFAARLTSFSLKTAILKTCGVVLLVAATLIISDKMTVYKSFLVGWFVDTSLVKMNHN
tara:strand:+ start:19127 stop:19852 length:726 start_codon:yes stop_codon:yes gene_type:complete